MAIREEARYAITAEDRSRAAFAQFNQRLATAGRNAKQAGDRASGFFGMGRIGIAAAGVAAVAGISKITSMANATFESMDEINKLSERSGVGVEFLSRFAHVAELGGASLGEVTSGLRRFSANLGEAARTGKGAAHEAFRQLGIDAKILGKATPEEQLLSVADALSRVRSEAQRSDLAQDIFGRSGFSLLNTFAGGASGIVDQMKEAQALGIGFSKADADIASAAVDAKTRRDAALSGVGQDAATLFAPFQISANNRATELITSLRDLESVSAGDLAVKGAASVVGGLLPGLPVEAIVNGIRRAFGDENEKTLEQLREIKQNTAKGNVAVAG